MKKLLLVVFTFVFIADSSSQIISENFNSGIPGTWTVNTGVSDAGTAAENQWHGTTGGFNPFGVFGDKYISGGTEFVIVDSESSGLQNQDHLESPSFDGTSYTSITLDYKQVYDPTGASSVERGYVQVWNGSTWNTVLTMDSDTYGTFLTPSVPTIDVQTGIDLTPYKNAAMKVRFSYYNNGQNGYWWAIDDVVITGVSSGNPPTTQFTVSNTSICEGSAVLFTDQSSDGPSSWEWTITPSAGVTFTGGTNSSSQNPQVTFASAGDYTVKLKSTNSNGSDSLTKTDYISVLPGATVSADSDQTFCANNASGISIDGTIGGSATGSVWTSSGDNGTITNTSSLSTTYNPTQSDIDNGTVTLTLSTLGGGCSSISDNMVIDFTSAPIVNAGVDQAICETELDLDLNGSVTVASGMMWSTLNGSGNFDLNTSSSPTYTMHANDYALGTLEILLTSTGNGSCNAESDTVLVTFQSEPSVDAGIDQQVCETVSDVSLSGSVMNASGVMWSTTGGGSFDMSTSTNPVYTLNANDANLSSLEFVAVSTGNGMCMSVYDTIIVNLQDAPMVDAGDDQTICVDSIANINGMITGATSGEWSTSGSGSFTSAVSELDNIYTPSSDDTTLASVGIYLTSVGNGVCDAVVDTMNLVVENCSDSVIDLLNETYNNKVSIYPNPSFGNEFYINTEKKSNLIVYNIQGKVVHSEVLKIGINSIEMKNIEKGIYLLTITSIYGDSRVSQKLTIK